MDRWMDDWIECVNEAVGKWMDGWLVRVDG